jgi:hypothetical protein
MCVPLYLPPYQINTSVWLTELSKRLGHPATLDDVPDSELNRFADLRFDWVWYLSVWRTGQSAVFGTSFTGRAFGRREKVADGLRSGHRRDHQD